MIWLVLIAGLLVTAFTGVPIGAGLALTGLAVLHFMGGGSEALAVTAVWNVFVDFTMSAVPAFIIMGEILLFSGLSKRIYSSMEPLFRRFPGGLLHTNIAMCALFGSVAGSSTATAAAVGSVAYPALRDRGYSRPVVVGSLAAGGTLGLLIPPGNTLLLYGAMQNVSIGQLFIGGMLPGIMLSIMFMMAIAWIIHRNPTLAPQATGSSTLREKLIALWETWPLMLLFTVVIGSIVFGLATATESAGIGVVMAIVLGFIWGDLTWKLVWRSFVSGVYAFGAIGLVVAGALILAQAISLLGVPQAMMQTITDWKLGPYQALTIVVVAYLILGCFFDGLSLLLMTVPFVHPLLTGLGFNAVWLGVIITVCIEIGMITPPVGMNLFVLTAITKNEVSLAQAARASVPYFFVMLIALVILTVFPNIILFLPNLMKN